MATGTLILVRPKQWCDRFSKYRIFVNGDEVGRIACNESRALELPEGQHEVVARIQWARSNVLPCFVRPSEVTEVEVGATAHGWLLLAGVYFATLGFRRYLYLRHRIRSFPVVLDARTARYPAMEPRRRKRFMMRLAMAACLVVAYVGSYVVLSAAGDYRASQSGKLRYFGGLSMTDCDHWQPKLMWWEPFRDVSGKDTSRGDLLGYFYSPLIRIDRAWRHPSHDLSEVSAATRPTG